MRQRKVFVGIQLPALVRKKLAKKIEKWQDLPIIWIKKDNFHITLSFIGYVSDESIVDICRNISQAVAKIAVFDIRFGNIKLGPEKDKPNLIWLEGDSSDELKNLDEIIAKNLGVFTEKRKEFRPHVTLGRLRAKKWETLPEKPEIFEKFSVSVPVESVDVFESREENGKRKYFILESCLLS